MLDTPTKNIIVCADGTGNTTIKDRGTNVFKLYEAVDQNGHRRDPSLMPQIAIYHDGVGTETLKWVRIFAGATGFGLSRNVRQLYGGIARVYEPGDHIYLFGFSRGAFTVRTLAGLILTCGVLKADAYRTNNEFRRAVRQLYASYRQKYEAPVANAVAAAVRRLRPPRPVDIKLTVTPQDARIRFIGVWDTVDAVGLPFPVADKFNEYVYAFKFRTTKLDPRVDFARHALALDEERESFAPVVWDEREAREGQIRQVWFAGVHSNVGGGYPRQGMSLEALEWMMAEAHNTGLRFVPGDRERYYEHADVNDKMYDPRAGSGIFYRWQPRNVEALRAGKSAGPALVHRSAFERIARNTEGYVPGSLPPEVEVVSSTMGPTDWRTRAIETCIKDAHAGGPSLVERYQSTLKLGEISYWLSLAATLLVAAIGLVVYVQQAWDAAANPTVPKKLAAIASGIVRLEWVVSAATTLWNNPIVLTLGVVLLALGFGLQLWTDRTMDRRYATFWHPQRDQLRVALGLQPSGVAASGAARFMSIPGGPAGASLEGHGVDVWDKV